MGWERDNAFEEAAKIAEKWREENKDAENTARKHGNVSMADRLAGAAVECNAIASAIRELKGTAANRQVWREPSLRERPY